MDRKKKLIIKNNKSQNVQKKKNLKKSKSK